MDLVEFFGSKRALWGLACNGHSVLKGPAAANNLALDKLKLRD